MRSVATLSGDFGATCETLLGRFRPVKIGRPGHTRGYPIRRWHRPIILHASHLVVDAVTPARRAWGMFRRPRRRLQFLPRRLAVEQ